MEEYNIRSVEKTVTLNLWVYGVETEIQIELEVMKKNH